MVKGKLQIIYTKLSMLVMIMMMRIVLMLMMMIMMMVNYVDDNDDDVDPHVIPLLFLTSIEAAIIDTIKWRKEFRIHKMDVR